MNGTDGSYAYRRTTKVEIRYARRGRGLVGNDAVCMFVDLDLYDTCMCSNNKHISILMTRAK